MEFVALLAFCALRHSREISASFAASQYGFYRNEWPAFLPGGERGERGRESENINAALLFVGWGSGLIVRTSPAAFWGGAQEGREPANSTTLLPSISLTPSRRRQSEIIIVACRSHHAMVLAGKNFLCQRYSKHLNIFLLDLA